MSDLEKKFKSLKQHEVMPPPAAWEQLNGQLVQKRKRKAVAYWRVAAVVSLLLLGTTVFLLFRNGDQASPMAGSSVPTDSVVGVAQPTEEYDAAEKPMVASSGALDSMDITVAPQNKKSGISPLAERTEVSVSDEGTAPPTDLAVDVARPGAARPTESTVDAAQPTVAQTLQPLHRVAPSSVALASAPAVDRSEEHMGVAALPENHPVATADDDSEQSRTEPTVAASQERSPVAQRRTVTIIYKPGGQRAKANPSDSETGLFAKTLSFLGDVKENGIGYSELRSAKSELVDQVFSRKGE